MCNHRKGLCTLGSDGVVVYRGYRDSFEQGGHLLLCEEPDNVHREVATYLAAPNAKSAVKICLSDKAWRRVTRFCRTGEGRCPW